jgi:hypothetical protein
VERAGRRRAWGRPGGDERESEHALNVVEVLLPEALNRPVRSSRLAGSGTVPACFFHPYNITCGVHRSVTSCCPGSPFRREADREVLAPKRRHTIRPGLFRNPPHTGGPAS